MKLEKIERITEVATPGPWIYDWGNHQIESSSKDYWRSPICDEIGASERNHHHEEFDLSSELICPSSDMEFISMARAEMPKLIAVVKAAKIACNDPDLQAEDFSNSLDKLAEAIQELEKEE